MPTNGRSDHRHGRATIEPLIDEDVEHPDRPGRGDRPPHRSCVRSNGLVIFAHGSGSSRHSPRNQYVASVLNEAGLATLLFDLLTNEEELNRSNVFDIDLLAHRLIGVAAWARGQQRLADLPTGYFGASTGAGAALWAAADAWQRRGGRGLPRWSPRPRRTAARCRSSADTAHRRWPRHRGNLILNRQAQARARLVL